MNREDQCMVISTLLIWALVAFTGAVIAYADDVSCVYLLTNNIGDYVVSLMPNGEYEIQWHYYMMRLTVC